MLIKRIFIFFLVVLAVVFCSSCLRQKKGFAYFSNKGIKVALVISGPINDSYWNLAAYSGLKRFQSDYKTTIAVVERVGLSEASEVFSVLAEKGYNLIIGHGYEYGFVLKRLAKKYAKTFFCVIGGEIKQDNNLCSFGFKDEQYGYLIGVAAGLNTTTNKVGIVVGKKVPSIERAIIGMRQGLRAVNPKADLVVSYVDSWDNVSKGKEAALAQINTGVDVVTHLADQGGIGVIRAAEDADISAVGAIVDQQDLAPTTVITSGIQDISQLVFLVCQYYKDAILESKVYRFGLRNQVIDLAPSRGNIDPTTETRINRIKEELIQMEIDDEMAKSMKNNRR